MINNPSVREQIVINKRLNKRLLDTYGITLEEWHILLKKQNYTCAICPSTSRLYMDHRHVPNYRKLPPEKKKLECRSALCFRCNKFTIGSLEIHKNAREILDNVVKYFSVYKMKGDK